MSRTGTLEIVFDDPSWPELSPTARQLVTVTSTAWLENPDDLFERIDEVVIATSPELSDDPSVTDLARATVRAMVLHWVTCNRDRPGERVAPLLTAETLDVERDAVRRGMLQSAANTYRRGVSVAWTYLMDLAFATVNDTELLREVLDWAARSIFTFVDDTIRGIEQRLQDEHRDLVSGSAAERMKAVQALLDGAPLSAADAHLRLGYDLSAAHTAAIVWRDEAAMELDQAVARVAESAGVAQHLIVPATIRSVWAWFSATAEELSGAWDALGEGARVAVGATRTGVEGFRQSHHDAVMTREVMGERGRVVRLEDVQAVALSSADPDRAADFIARVLGPLTDADPDLSATLRAYLSAGSNLAAAARALHIHKNTAAYRLSAAQRLLPVDLDAQRLDVALALELLRWLGAPQVAGASADTGRAPRT